MGLGLGANQTIPTVIAGPGILMVMVLFKWTRRGNDNKNLYLSIDWKNPADSNSDRLLNRLNEVISKHVLTSDLRRFDVRPESIEATYFLDIASTDQLSALVDELRNSFPMIGVTFLDQNQLPSI